MALFAILCALLIEQLYPLPMRNPVYLAHKAVADWAVRNLDAGRALHGWISWSFAVVLPACGSALAYKFLLWLGWPLAWLWAALVLYLTLGFRQFSGHITAIRDALDMGDEIKARQVLAAWKGLDASDLPRSDIVRQVLEHAVLDAHRHVFGVLVAFVVCAAFGLGPAGAVLFRSAEFVQRYWRQHPGGTAEAGAPRRMQCAWQAWQVINWLPARATTAVFAAAGNFEQAVDNWRQQASMDEAVHGWPDADAVVLAAALGAVDMPWLLPERPGRQAAPHGDVDVPNGNADASTVALTHDTFMPPDVAAPRPALAQSTQAAPQFGMHHLQHLVGLVWRSVILWGGLIALVTVTHWVSN